jgi:hypothetical protein
MKNLIKKYFTAIATWTFWASFLWFIGTTIIFSMVNFGFSEEFWIHTKLGFWLFNIFGVRPLIGSLLIGVIVFFIHLKLARCIRSKYITWDKPVELWDEPKRVWFKILVTTDGNVEFKKSFWGKGHIFSVLRPFSTFEKQFGRKLSIDPEDFNIHANLEFDKGCSHLTVPINIIIKLEGRPSIQEIILFLTYHNMLAVTLGESTFDLEKLIYDEFVSNNQNEKIGSMLSNCFQGKHFHAPLDLVAEALIFCPPFSTFISTKICVDEPIVKSCLTIQTGGKNGN